jgi:hypothetical protein
VNSNGLRLAGDETYVKALAEAGLSFVFMQFDGVGDDVQLALRGAPLYQEKLAAIRMCDKYRIGVTLVPTIVRGVNDDQIGEIIRFGASLSPAVRGVHFQPVSYFGRYPGQPSDESRYTLDELLDAVSMQAGIPLSALLPSRCDHPLCGFHGSFLANGDALSPLSYRDLAAVAPMTTAEQNREYVGRRWSRVPEEEQEQDCCCEEGDTDCRCEEGEVDCCCEEGEADCCCEEGDTDCCCEEGDTDCRCEEGMETFDGFLDGVKRHGFTLTAMVFQDAMNLDVERLRRCSLRVYHEGVLKPFCARYITGM